MAIITQRPTVQVSANFLLDEEELRALDALVGYGTDKFIDAFYKVMGKAYLEPHAAGLRRLFETFSKHVPGILSRANAAREAFGP